MIQLYISVHFIAEALQVEDAATLMFPNMLRE